MSARFLPDRRSAVAAAATVVAAVMFAAWSISGVGDSEQREVISDAVPLFFGVAALSAGLLAARSAAGEGARRAWFRLAGATALWLAGDAIWFFEEVVRHRQPFPSWADAGYLAFYPFAAWAVLSFRGRSRHTTDTFKVTLDGLTVMVAATMAVWYLVVGPTVHSGSGAGFAGVLSVAYPVGDLILVFCVIAILMRQSGANRPLRLLLGGVASFVVADLAYAHLSLTEAYQGGDWPDVFWVLGQSLFVLAALVARHSDGASSGARRPLDAPLPVARLPYVAVAVAYGLLIVVGHDMAAYPLNGLLLGAATITVLVLVRQVTVMAENVRLAQDLHRLAAVDTLTGIPNRRTFLSVAEDLLASSASPALPLSLLMLDVDNFKTINDSYGHAAGDCVLTAVAAAIQGQLRQTDVVGRYGGDEMVVALSGCGEAAAMEVAERIRSLVAETPIVAGGNLIPVNLSIGVATGDPACELATLLGHADQALYAAKQAGRACSRQFSAV